MFISIQDLGLQRIDFREEFRPQAIDFGPGLQQLTTLATKGRAELLEEHGGGRRETIRDIRIVGDFSTRIAMKCARCLEPVERDVADAFDLLYRPLGVDAGRDEASINQAETEIGYYQGEGLLLEDVLREQLLLAMPIRAVCREDCKGLCPRCGHNLNLEACQCPKPLDDPRWGGLQQIRDKLKS